MAAVPALLQHDWKQLKIGLFQPKRSSISRCQKNWGGICTTKRLVDIRLLSDFALPRRSQQPFACPAAQDKAFGLELQAYGFKGYKGQHATFESKVALIIVKRRLKP